MTKSVLSERIEAIESIVVRTFDDGLWDSLMNKIGGAFSLSEEILGKYRENAVFKLVGALPYLAGCDEPERVALSHLGTYMLAALPATKGSFAHSFRDSADLYHRLERISHFPGGDQKVVEWGMKLLIVAMINDHIQDADDDRSSGKLNPITAGHWNADEILATIKEELDGDTPRDLEVFLSNVGTQGYWAD